MAPYHIRMYLERDRKSVLALFSQGMEEHIPSAFRHLLRQPRTLLLLPGVPLVLLLLSGSWLLALLASLAILAVLRLAASYPWKKYMALSLQTDMADITKSYLRGSGSCFWVAESEGQVVGTVGALPVQDPTLREKQLQLFHLSVALEHRGQGIAKALVRTVIQFARAQGYSEVMLDTTAVQTAALSLYQGMGFKITGQYYFHGSSTCAGAPSGHSGHRDSDTDVPHGSLSHPDIPGERPQKCPGLVLPGDGGAHSQYFPPPAEAAPNPPALTWGPPRPPSALWLLAPRAPGQPRHPRGPEVCCLLSLEEVRGLQSADRHGRHHEILPAWEWLLLLGGRV